MHDHFILGVPAQPLERFSETAGRHVIMWIETCMDSNTHALSMRPESEFYVRSPRWETEYCEPGTCTPVLGSLIARRAGGRGRAARWRKCLVQTSQHCLKRGSFMPCEQDGHTFPHSRALKRLGGRELGGAAEPVTFIPFHPSHGRDASLSPS